MAQKGFTCAADQMTEGLNMRGWSEEAVIRTRPKKGGNAKMRRNSGVCRCVFVTLET